MKPLLLTITILFSLALGIIKVNTGNQFFVDEEGRVRLFHGVNAVYKLPPWHPQTTGFDPQLSLSSIDIANLKAWGFNAVRLGMMWPGVEPTRGAYDANYVKVMQGIVDALAKEGIYTILDAHQDVYNRKFCGEGFPDWTVIEEGILPFALPFPGIVPNDPNLGMPNLTSCLKHTFAEYYLSDKVNAAFGNFYDDVQGIQAAFGGYWTYVAEAFKNNSYVLGYELLNEPWAGNIFENPGLLTPGEADRVNLQPLYEMLHTKIRAVDDEHILFFEQSLVSVTPPNGFTQGPGGPSYNDRQAFSYHIYCGPTDDQGNPSNVVECDIVDTVFYGEAERNQKRLGCGGFMTEFGAMSNATNSIENLQFLTGAADTFLQSWTYWQFKLFDDITTSGSGESFYLNSQLENSKVKALSRTYAQAVAGVPVRMSFDPITSTFQLVYKIDTSITAPSIIYMNQAWYYPTGFHVEISPPGLVKYFQTDKNFLQILNLPTAPNGSQVTVKITQESP